MANNNELVNLANSSAMTKRKTHHRKIWLAKAFLRSCFWHWLGIPAVALALKIIHLWRSRKHGISYPKPTLLWSKSYSADREGTQADPASCNEHTPCIVSVAPECGYFSRT